MLGSSLLALGLSEATWVTGAERPLALAPIVVLTVPLMWRRSAPSAVALLVTAAIVMQLPWAALRTFDQTFTGFVCMLLASYAVGRHERRPRARRLLVGCALAVAGTLGWDDRSVATFVLCLILVVASAATGSVVAARSALHDLIDHQADALRRSAEVAERTRIAAVRGRIAGEVQDLVSRRVDEMVDRSEAARGLVQSDGSGAAALVATVEEDGRAALDEMRAMLGVLRSPDLSGTAAQNTEDGPPGGDGPARSLPLRRVEVLLSTAVLAFIIGEMLVAPGQVPVVSLTMLAPLLTFVVGARTSGRSAWCGLGLALAAVAAVNLWVVEGRWGDYVFPSALVALSWLGGRLVREQNDLVQQSRRGAAALERSAEVRAAAAATEERLRLARELHDVLAHTLMVMVVQAGAARRSIERGRAGAESALRAVEETGRDASTELRRLLTLVDPQLDATGPEHDGSPGLDDLLSLVDRARAAGLGAELVVEGEPVPVPVGLALSAYRVAQEAVTNVIRHAEATHIHLRLHYAPAQLRLEVSDDGRASRAVPERAAGNGITGMRERAAIYSGQLSAAPSPGRGFVVTAIFPVVQDLQEEPA